LINDTASVGALLQLVADRLATTDLTHAAQLYPDPNDLADRMLASLPDKIISEPLIGPCYSTSALARWKRLTRQAVNHQRTVGTLFGVEHKASFYFPAVQFDNRGRQTRSFRELWNMFTETDGEPLAFAVWLQTPDPATGLSPARVLRDAPDNRTDEQRMMDEFEPTIVEPPTGAHEADASRRA